ncbi:glycosyltransferase [Candidatus Margulisiibacteriota bacterium]
MKILIVAMIESIHTNKWIKQIVDQNWDIHLFPSTAENYESIYPKLRNKNITFHCQRRANILFRVTRKILAKIYNLLGIQKNNIRSTSDRGEKLANLIKKLKPDLIHSHETQAAGYLVLEAKKHLSKDFPFWAHTVWGSDLVLFGRQPEHKDKIKNVLNACDFFISDNQRDIELANSFGFTGRIFTITTVIGGFDLDQVARSRHQGPASERKAIILKGYQGWAGRALVGLQALEKCQELILKKNLDLIIYAPNKEVITAARSFSKNTRIPTTIIEHDPHNYKYIMDSFGRSRIFIGLSISDGVPGSFLEALALGAFPIQSWTSAANEWLLDGKTGILVPPEEPDTIAQAIRKAINADELINKAAEHNYRLAKEKLDENIIKKNTTRLYKEILEDCTK